MGPRQRWGGLRGALLGAVAAIACMDVVGAAVAETRMGHATAAYRRALQRRAQAGKTSLVEVEATAEGGGSPAMMKGGSCLGAKDKCACQVPGESSDCEVIESTCANLLCHPLCLMTTFSCRIEAGGAYGMAAQDPIASALCGEIVAQACVDFECCTAEDPTLVDWVENKVYQDSFPDMAMRIERCKHDQRDKARSEALCKECKAASIKPSLSKQKGHCEYGMNPSPARRLLSYLRGRRLLKEQGLLPAVMRTDELLRGGAFRPPHDHPARRGRRSGRLMQPGGNKRDLGAVETALMELQAGAGAGASAGVAPGGGFPGIGAMKSFQEMCETMVDGMSFGDIVGKATPEKLCECIGCCDPGEGSNYCFFEFAQDV